MPNAKPSPPPAAATSEEAEPDPALRAKLKQTFDSFDKDGSGEISIDEITELLVSLGVSASTETIMACVKEADTDNSGEISFEEFYSAMRKSSTAGFDNGHGSNNTTFADLVRDATQAEDIGRSIEEANVHFLSEFNDFVISTLDRCQTEVLAAKVPLASYGRVKSALDQVKSELTGTAQDLLRKEFGQLRTRTVDGLAAQKIQLEEEFKTRVASGIDKIKMDAENRVKEADKLRKVAEANVKKVEQRFAEPQALVTKLEAQVQETNDKVAALEAKIAKYTDDWNEVYPKVTALCTIQMYHTHRFAPILEVLTQRGISSAKHFYEKLDLKGDGKVDKSAFIRNLRAIGLSTEMLGDIELGHVFTDMDVDHSDCLSFKEVAAALQRWKRVHIPDAKAKPRADDWMAKAFKSLAPEALGSRMLYLVECYEETIKAREERHTLEETISTEEKLGKDAEFEKERIYLKAAKEEAEALLASERAEHQVEVSRLKETVEAASAKQTKADKEDVDELKRALKKKQSEVRGYSPLFPAPPLPACVSHQPPRCTLLLQAVRPISFGGPAAQRRRHHWHVAHLSRAFCRQLDELGEKLRGTVSELKSTSQAKDNEGQEYAQLIKQREAEVAAYEARLHSVLTALAKAKAAQPRHGGYYFAAAPLVTRSLIGNIASLSPSSSREPSPTRSIDGTESIRSFSPSPTSSPIRQFLYHQTSVSREGSPTRASNYGPGYSPSSAGSPSSTKLSPSLLTPSPLDNKSPSTRSLKSARMRRGAGRKSNSPGKRSSRRL
jgi:Ca2+-binding EF-hand superfamily protein